MDKNVFYYKRWDGVMIRFLLNEGLGSNRDHYTIDIIDISKYDEEKEKSKNTVVVSASCIHVESTTMLCLRVVGKEYRVELDEFYSKLEGVKYEENKEGGYEQIPGNVIKIANLSDYIDAIEYYRYISLLEHLRAIVSQPYFNVNERTTVKTILKKQLIATYTCDVTFLESEEIKKDKKDKEDKEDYLSKIKEDLDNQSQEEMLKELRKVIILAKKHLHKEIKLNDTISDKSKEKFFRAIELYEKGESLCYYRGVGQLIYPEAPGIFRKNRLCEEARWYRGMKTYFFNELDQLHYLDRLAMLQHYEVPTRLLDVTSNPLVALYMAVNKEYIPADTDQQDYGEVIVHFDEFSDSKAYDSNSVLVLAALAKLSYDEKEVLKEVINNVNQGIAENKMEKEDAERLFNFCVHRSAESMYLDYVFSNEEKKNVNELLRDLERIPDDESIEEIIEPSEIYYRLTKKLNKGNKEKEEEGDENKKKREDDENELKKECQNKYKEFVRAYVKLLGTIRRENPAFTNSINVFMLMKAFHVRVGMTNDRIRAQAGSFIICGLDENYINTSMRTSRSRWIRRMFIKDKREVYHQLNTLEINDRTMLLDMPHHASYLVSQSEN